MKRLTFSIGIALAFTAGLLHAQQPHQGSGYRVGAEDVNMRGWPDVDRSNLVGVAYSGSLLADTGKTSGRWIQVAVEGWVPIKGQGGVYMAPARGRGGEDNLWEVLYEGGEGNPGLYLRDSITLPEQTVLAELKAGTQVEVIERQHLVDYSWARIRLTAWMASSTSGGRELLTYERIGFQDEIADRDRVEPDFPSERVPHRGENLSGDWFFEEDTGSFQIVWEMLVDHCDDEIVVRGRKMLINKKSATPCERDTTTIYVLKRDGARVTGHSLETNCKGGRIRASLVGTIDPEGGFIDLVSFEDGKEAARIGGYRDR